MGYLDHSTNNIILDAVLTDYGRQKLSSGGQFKITTYALGDDEVDYGIIKKYGRTVGKEKIEKNTPIFEALTNPSIALKYALVGRAADGSSIDAAYLPVLKLTSPSSGVQLKTGTTSSDITVTLSHKGSTGNSIPSDYRETTYTIRVSDRFFTLSGTSVSASGILVSAGDPNRIAVYTYDAKQQSTVTFTVNARSIDDTTLSIYGANAGNNTRIINSYITVIGDKFGTTINIPVSYSR